MTKAEEEFEAWWADPSVIAFEQEYAIARQAWLASREATAKRCVEICRNVYGGPAHTYASENADVYRAQDQAIEKCAQKIEREFLK